MNVSARTHTLIIGIGNPLRSDDGLGWAVAHMLSQDAATDCAIHMVHQLTPELAVWMAEANLVVMVDASREGVPGELRVRPLSSSAVQPGAVGTHYSTPEELAALTTIIYGYCPPITVITMTGADFGLSEQLSPLIAQKLPLICEAVRHTCKQG